MAGATAALLPARADGRERSLARRGRRYLRAHHHERAAVREPAAAVRSRRREARGLLPLVVALALALATGACSGGDSDTAAVDREIDELLGWTAPDGARVTGATPCRRGVWSVETSWEVETEEDWPTYRAAVDRAPQEVDYQRGRSGEAGASYFSSESGDTYYLHVEVLGHGPPLRVRVSFAARAG